MTLVSRRTQGVSKTAKNRKTTRSSFGNTVPIDATCTGRMENLSEKRMKIPRLALLARRLTKSPGSRGLKTGGTLGLAPQEPVVLAVLPDAAADQGDVGHNAMSDGRRNRPTVTMAVSSSYGKHLLEVLAALRRLMSRWALSTPKTYRNDRNGHTLMRTVSIATRTMTQNPERPP